MGRLCTILSLLLIVVSPRGATHPPRSVIDYYLLLPSDYFDGLATDTRSERLRLLRDFKGSSVDRPHGFLHIRGDGAQSDLTVCLFKRPNGSYLVAVNSNTASDGVWGPSLDFYTYQQGHLVNVTKAVRPAGINQSLASCSRVMERPLRWSTGAASLSNTSTGTGRDFNSDGRDIDRSAP